MCGGMVTFISGQSGSKWWHQGLYHFGRLLAYALLGVVAGTLGNVINQLSGIAGFRYLAALISALLLIYWGVRSAFFGKSLGWTPRLGSLVAKTRPYVGRSFGLGCLSGIFPCGWLYMWVAVAAGTGSAVMGALVMAVFWAGTVPALACLGAFSKILTSRLGGMAPRAAGVLLILAGLWTIAVQFFGLLGHGHHHHVH